MVGTGGTPGERATQSPEDCLRKESTGLCGMLLRDEQDEDRSGHWI